MTPLKKKQSFYLGKWMVTPDQNKLKNLHEVIFVEPKLMEVLTYLCINAPTIINIENLIENCWPDQIISDSPVHKCIAKLRKVLGDTIKDPQYLKTISKRGYSIVADIKGIDNDSSVNQITWHNNVPYLGLQAYDTQQQAVFFGRSKAIAEIKSLVNNRVSDDLPLLLIEGLSTAGKTSLINTTIIPCLELSDSTYNYSDKHSYHYDLSLNLNNNFASTFIGYLIKNNIFNAWLDKDKYLQQLKQSLKDIEAVDKHDSLNTPIQLNQKQGLTQHIIFIDHFERVLVEQDENSNEVNLMVLLITELLKTNDYFILIAIRSENYQALNDSKAFSLIKQKITHYNLLPPNSFEITEIVQKPVLAAGLRYEFNESTFESLDKTIIEDSKNMGNILPILSHTLKELCESCNDQQQLTFEIYDKIGGLTGALTYNIGNVLNTLSICEKNLFSNNLHHLIQYKPGMQKEYVASKVNVNLFKDDKLYKLINYLIDHGMLQSHNIGSEIFVSILHDSILQECIFFKKWIANNHLKLSIVTEVKTLARQWFSSDKKKEYLLNNYYLLDQAHQIIKEDKAGFSPNQSLFLKLSHKQQSNRAKLKHSAVALLVTLLVFSFILLIINKKTSAALLNTNNSAENLITFMIGDLKNKLLPLGKLELLEIVGDQVINYYDDRTELIRSEQSSLQYNKALNTIGEVEVNQGKLLSAENIFRQAIKQDLDFFKDNSSKASALFNYGQSNYWLGYINYLQKKYKTTLHYWSIYLDLSEQLLVIEPNNESWKLEKSYALNNLGSLNYQQNNLVEADKYFNLSAQLKKEMVRDNPANSQYLAELADTISWQANICDKRNELQRSNELYKESLSLSEKLVSMDNENKVWIQRLALANYRVALSHYNLGELLEVKHHLEKSLPIYIDLNIFDKTNQIWINELINNYIMVSKVYRHNLDLDNASLNLKKGQILFDSYSLGSKKLESAQVQNLSLNIETSLVSLELGQNKTALDQFKSIVNQLKANDASKLFNKDHQRAYINFVLARIKKANQQVNQANLLLTEALILLNDGILESRKKENMALYVSIEKSMGVEPRQDLVAYLKKISYKNPDFIQSHQ